MDEMHARIVEAIVEHRLAPGTKLREERLAELFQVSRTQVRPVLQRLEHEGLVERQPRRGAVVAAPSREATRLAVGGHSLSARRDVRNDPLVL